MFALTTRGLESVSAQEMATLAGLEVISQAYRRVGAVAHEGLVPLLGLRTVDDVFLHLATWTGIGRGRSVLQQLADQANALPLRDAVDLLRPIRVLPAQPSFAVTASFVGRRNYSSREIRAFVGQAVRTSHGLAWEERDSDADLNLRLFIEHETAYVGIRLGQSPLHRRPYKIAHVPGSLKPPVAASMLWLAEAAPNSLIVDPCCGAGTILIEATALGYEALGGDIAMTAVRAARTNAARSSGGPSLCQWDARALPLAGERVRAVVTNLPWGGEVAVGVPLREVYAQIVAQIERVTATGGRAVVLTDRPELVVPSRVGVTRTVGISLFGRTPTIVVLSDA